MHHCAGDQCVRESIAQASMWAGGGLHVRALSSCTPGCSSWKTLGHFAQHHMAGGEGDGVGLCNRDGAARFCSWPNLGNSNPCSCPRVSSRISSGHPVPAANPALVVHKALGPMCRKFARFHKMPEICFSPWSSLAAKSLGEERHSSFAITRE